MITADIRVAAERTDYPGYITLAADLYWGSPATTRTGLPPAGDGLPARS
jgi:hypothetical protein